MRVIQRQESLQSGNPYYFTGKPCKHGHVSIRRTKNRLCLACELSRDHKSDYQKRKVAQLKQKKEYHNKNKEKLNEKSRLSHQENKKQRLEKQREYYRSNKGKAFERAAIRNKRIKDQAPTWCERDKISKLYSKASELGFHVDHVVPLKSEIVCGLHCWHNLQLLDPEINISKSNRYWVDMP